MSTKEGSCRGTRVSWLVAVSVVTLLAALAVSVGPVAPRVAAGAGRQTHSKSSLKPLAGAANRPTLTANYGKLPLAFEANNGQTSRQADFVSRGPGYTLFLSGGEATLSLRKPVAGGKSKLETRNSRLAGRVPSREPQVTELLRMKLVGANAHATAKGMEKLPGVSNYYIGSDPKKWRTGVSNYAKAHYDDVYPGVDLVYYGNQRQLEYDFVVAPGANPGSIALSFEGQKNEKRNTKIDAKGDLVITAAAGEVRFHKPVVYQELSAGARQAVEGKFKLLAENRVGFEVGAYDKTRPLVIDPTLIYSTYLGGTEMDAAAAITVDASGNAHVAGTAGLNDFDGSTTGSYGGGFSDTFVAKLNSTATAIDFITYAGGDGGEDATGIAFDTDGGVIVTGSTDSTNFPMGTPVAGGTDAYIFKLDTAGVLQGSIIFGGTGLDGSSGVVVDANGTIYFTGPTTSTDLTILNGFQNACSSCVSNSTYDAFVAVYTATGPGLPTLAYSSYLGGDSTDYPHGVALSPSGTLWVIGESVSTDFPTTSNGIQQSDPDSGLFNDAFLAEFDTTQTGAASLLYSSYLGGDGDDAGYGIAVDGSANLFILGSSDSSEAPVGSTGFDSTPNGFQDVVVTKFRPSDNTILYYGLLGGSGADAAGAITIDSEGAAYVTGNTNSTEATFPLVNPTDGTYNGGFNDAFVAKIHPNGGSIQFSTFLGGGDNEFGSGIALDTSKNVYVVGQTNSSDFTTTGGVIQTACLGGGSFATCADGFVTKIQISAPSGPQLTPTPGALAFGNVATATTSTKVVQIKNTGTTTLTLSSIIFSNNNADVFETDGATTTCTNSSAIPANDSCDIGINFTPAAELDYAASLGIGSDDPNTPTNIALTGTGAAAIPAITANPTSLNFGNVTVDSPSTKIVTVTNTGTGPLTITLAGITITQVGTDYAIAAAQTTCVPGTPIAVDASCNVGVTLTPGSEATFNGTLNILSDAPTSPTQVNMTGVGTVSAAAIDVSPAGLDFGTAQVGSVVNYPVTVTNTGTEDLIISAITVSGADAANFTSPAAGTTCAVGAHIAPDASCVITADFHSTAIATFNATLTINSNAANAPSASGPLTGKGSDFQFAVAEGGSTSATVSAGQTAGFNLQIGGTPGAAGTATMGCIENISNASCGVQPTMVVLNDTTPSPITVGLATIAPTPARVPLLMPNSGSGGLKSLPISWMWIAALAMMLATMAASRRRARVIIMASMLFVVLWSSCIGNSPRATTIRATPAGIYTVTVTATVNGVTKSFPLTVTVN